MKSVKKREKMKKILKKHNKKTVRKTVGKKILKAYKGVLLEKREELINKVRERMNEGKEYNKQEVRDMADQASDSYENESLYSLSDTERKYLEEVENALRRVDEGTYSKCDSCSKLIGFERLKSLPFSRLCIKCQENNEKSTLRR